MHLCILCGGLSSLTVGVAVFTLGKPGLERYLLHPDKAAVVKMRSVFNKVGERLWGVWYEVGGRGL